MHAHALEDHDRAPTVSAPTAPDATNASISAAS